MADKTILHMLSPLRHVSPFDVNMAADAGFDVIIPYTGVQPGDVAGLVQDAIFSRPPQLGVRTGVFIGGKDAGAALDMLDAARAAMVPPFVVSLFADPAGSFTTAAAMVARMERALRTLGRDMAGLRVAVFGATGVVGFAAAVISALQGAEVTLAGHTGRPRVEGSAADMARRFGIAVDPADASTEPLKAGLLAAADAVFCAGPAGRRLLDAEQIRAAPNLLVVADVNAVPPLGIEGVDLHDDATPVGGGGTLGIGALAIGHTKYRTEFELFRRMTQSGQPVAYDFRDAFALARDLARDPA